MINIDIMLIINKQGGYSITFICESRFFFFGFIIIGFFAYYFGQIVTALISIKVNKSAIKKKGIIILIQN